MYSLTPWTVSMLPPCPHRRAGPSAPALSYWVYWMLLTTNILKVRGKMPIVGRILHALNTCSEAWRMVRGRPVVCL